MKIYFRILSYAPRIVTRITQFFIFSTVGTIFGGLTMAVAIPLLNILFDQVDGLVVSTLPDFRFSINYGIAVFHYYFNQIIIEHGKPGALLFVCILVVATRLVANVFAYFERVVASKLRVVIVKNLRGELFAKVTRLQIGFFNNKRKGDLISRFTSDVQEVESAVTNSLKVVMKEPITIIVYFGMLFFISVKLTLFSIVVLPVLGGALAELIKRLKRQAKSSQESIGRIVNILDETFSGMRVVKAFNARNYIIEKMNEENLRYSKVNLSMAYKNELSSPVSEFFGVMIIAGIMLYGGNLILSGGKDELEPAAFLTYIAIFAQIIQPAKSFSNGITSLQKGLASARRIFEVMDTEPIIENKANAILLKQFEKNIEFRNVSFAYDKDHVLQNINLVVEKGKTVALVGPSGGGKSTLADLIPRFYDPGKGNVLLDGIPLTDYDIESLRKQMGVVTQESILFNDTIFNNIAFGIENVNEEAVMHAAKVANAHDFIMQTEQGYQTYIGERGSKLSGGQRQRLSIARAVLKNPPILILDEATSALDSESERLVQDALTKLMEHRTSIVIAHRLSTIQHADEIIVIQNGMIVERGKHDDLILQNGLYKKLNEVQVSKA
jgi:subfamily B ATP-binding cassette protein MsbA